MIDTQSRQSGIGTAGTTFVRLGRSPYRNVWDLQRSYFDKRVEGSVPNLLILTEHDHVYTHGTGSDDHHLLASMDELRSLGADVFHVDRGGDITYHGPGQIVGYPIVHIGDFHLDAHSYLRALEEVIIRVLLDFGVKASRDAGLTGVWVGSEKIAAIGVRISHWITMHGFALNVNTDLGYFGRIIPCGIFHKGVTSMERILGGPLPMDEVNGALVRRFGSVFHCEMHEMTSVEFSRSMNQRISAECPE